jgi:hypothetical protein
MVQPNYSPKESLERVKLMMKYDTSKTLNENKEIVKEQAANVDGDIGEIMRELDKFNSDEQKIVDIIKKYNNNSSFQTLLNKYKSVSGKDLGSDVARAVSPYNDKNEWNDLKTHLSTFGVTLGQKITNGVNSMTFDGSSKTDTPGNTGGGKTGGGKTGGTNWKTNCKIYSIGCKSDVIAKVQGCLGLVADGKYGPKTNAKLKEIGYSSFTDADVDKICNKETPAAGTPAAGTPAAGTPAAGTPTKPDEIEQVDADDSTDLLNN